MSTATIMVDAALEVRPTLERYVYLVASENKPGIAYRVDLTSNRGAGCCACVDFGTRKQSAIDAGAEACTPASVCKHLAAAQLHFLREMLRTLSDIENKGESA